MGASDFSKLPHIGEALLRKEDYRFLTGAGNYTDDIRLADQCHAIFVRSPHAHATIKSIATARASAMPTRTPGGSASTGAGSSTATAYMQPATAAATSGGGIFSSSADIEQIPPAGGANGTPEKAVWFAILCMANQKKRQHRQAGS